MILQRTYRHDALMQRHLAPGGVAARRKEELMAGAVMPGTEELIDDLVRRLHAGESFDNPKLAELAKESFFGTRARGTYTARDAYDAFEIAVNKFLLEGKARELIQGGREAFDDLRSLTDRLLTQADRTVEQVESQQFSTPPSLALLAAKLLDPSPDDLVLEPSAGTGSLAIWGHAVGAQLVCNETSSRRRALLTSELGFKVHDVDGEIIDDVLPAEILDRKSTRLNSSHT